MMAGKSHGGGPVPSGTGNASAISITHAISKEPVVDKLRLSDVNGLHLVQGPHVPSHLQVFPPRVDHRPDAIDYEYEAYELEQAAVDDEEAEDSYEQWVRSQSPENNALLSEVAKEVELPALRVERRRVFHTAVRRLLIEESLRIRRHRWTQQRALSTLDTWALLLPERIATEILGDYVEDINRRTAAGQGRFKIYVRMLAAMFWTGVNAVGYFLKEVGKQKAT